MKTKLYWLALIIVSAALSVPAQAGNHRSNGNSAPTTTSARGGASAARGNFSTGGMMMPGQRFSSSMGVRSNAFHPNYIHSNGISSVGQHRVTAGTLNRGNGNRVGSVGNGNPVHNGAGNHVFARHSADWHRDWDRDRDHRWHGHRCRFVNGSWFIFDLGFFPWYGYPYDDYYAYGYGYGYDAYPYGYDTGVYEGEDAGYDNSGANGSSDQYANETVAAAQGRLARQGYYRGNIDGAYGAETRRAVSRYQSDHGLRVTGYLTTDTLRALGLRRGAS